MTVNSVLSLEEVFKGKPLSFNPADLTDGIITAVRRINMKDIGSDENYLSVHLAILVALHLHFPERNRSVPGVLVIDQNGDVNKPLLGFS